MSNILYMKKSRLEISIQVNSDLGNKADWTKTDNPLRSFLIF